MAGRFGVINTAATGSRGCVFNTPIVSRHHFSSMLSMMHVTIEGEVHVYFKELLHSLTDTLTTFSSRLRMA